MILTITFIPIPLSGANTDRDPKATTEFYPCSSCHATLKISEPRRYSEVHKKNLTLGAHAGLYCTNCHVPEDAMMNLTGGVELAIPGLHSPDSLLKISKLCGLCHADVLQDYEVFAHGNTTFTHGSGKTIIVRGYKGVAYVLHLSSDYKNFKLKHGRACVECHEPHNPIMEPPSILPRQSYRPPPPREGIIAYGGLLIYIISVVLVLASALLKIKGVW